MSYEELKSCFVGRQPLLDELLDTLREQAGASTLQHWMILGSRGMGKTHLIRLFHHEIIEDPDLTQKWLPILMHEEEQVVFNLPTLFTRIIEMLAESLENRGCRDAALSTSAFLDSLRHFSLAESLGGVESLVCHPASMTHAPVAAAVLKKAGINRNLIRLSIGIESADDLVADLINALAKAQPKLAVCSAICV